MVKDQEIQETRSHPWVRKTPGGGDGNPTHYSFLENLVDRGAWWAAVPGIAKSQAQLKRLHSATPGLLSLEPEGMGARIGLSLLSGIPNISTVLQAF